MVRLQAVVWLTPRSMGSGSSRLWLQSQAEHLAQLQGLLPSWLRLSLQKLAPHPHLL